MPGGPAQRERAPPPGSSDAEHRLVGAAAVNVLRDVGHPATAVPAAAVPRVLAVDRGGGRGRSASKAVAWVVDGLGGAALGRGRAGCEPSSGGRGAGSPAAGRRSPPTSSTPTGMPRPSTCGPGFWKGGLILLAAITIAVSATDRLVHPEPLSDAGVGSATAIASTSGSISPWGCCWSARAASSGSVALEADGRRLLTDVWTSVGVVVGVALVAITRWERLDPIVALAVAADALRLTGARLLRSSAGGLMDQALEDAAQDDVEQALAPFRPRSGQFHAGIGTRRAGRRAFISMHVLVPRRLDRSAGSRSRGGGGGQPSPGASRTRRCSRRVGSVEDPR